MPKKPASKTKKPKGIHRIAVHHVRRAGRVVRGRVKPHAVRAKGWWARRPLYQKILGWIIVILLVIVGIMYGVARWYIAKHANDPLKIGVTFIAPYARYYELDPQETMQAMIDDLGMRRFRLVSYWEEIEKEPGKYDFSDLDWQFKKAEESGSEVSLAIGLRQPRWPECHMPAWLHDKPKDVWYPQLKNVMTATINRYKDSPALESYQLENEFLLEVFGECKNFDRSRLVEEYQMVKKLDPDHPILVSRSNNAVPSWPIGEPRADMVGASIYKRVWDKTVTKRYFEYPLPAWFYAFLAGGTELTTGRNTIIHELQAEAWMPGGYDMRTSSVDEQYKSMSPDRMHNRLEYARATGMRTIDLWGAEWWYWRKVKFNDPALWDTAKQEIQRLTTSDKQCDNEAKTRANGYSIAPC